MKKNIIIGVLVLTNILFLCYAFQQKSEGDSAREMAIEQRLLAEENMRLAQQHAEMARVAEMQAVQSAKLAQQEVEKLRKELAN